jgi:hypothetical protein
LLALLADARLNAVERATTWRSLAQIHARRQRYDAALLEHAYRVARRDDQAIAADRAAAASPGIDELQRVPVAEGGATEA